MEKSELTPGRKAWRQILICGLILLVISFTSRLIMRNTYFADIPLEAGVQREYRGHDLWVEAEDASVLTGGEAQLRDGYVRVPVRPEGMHGSSFLFVKDREGNTVGQHLLQVEKGGAVRDLSSGGFSGDYVVMICYTLFFFLVSAVMVWHFYQSRGRLFYDYATIYFAGFSLFSLVTAVVSLILSVRHILTPSQFPMLSVYSAMSSASWHFVQLTTPLILAFALAMVVSNIALLRHTTPRIQNVLGILIAGMMIAGAGIAWWLFTRDFSGSEQEGRIVSTIHNVYATVYVYFECMLVGAVVCGLKATKMSPSLDRDGIIILGCGFRKDGTLPPLLRGRVDRAIAFWKEQKEKSGRDAVLIPSGGQGMDEVMPEAAAMKRYLLEQGIPEESIRTEEKSRNTFENMKFSGKILEEIAPGGKAVFATTNYHVFRSGVWAARAGVNAEGIGSRTKWWFWPNAFMRECLGLLKAQWKRELILLVILIAFFGTLTMALA